MILLTFWRALGSDLKSTHPELGFLVRLVAKDLIFFGGVFSGFNKEGEESIFLDRVFWDPQGLGASQGICSQNHFFLDFVPLSSFCPDIRNFFICNRN